MHDVSRDSFLRKQWDEKKRRHSGHGGDGEQYHNEDSHDIAHGHSHSHHQHSFDDIHEAQHENEHHQHQKEHGHSHDSVDAPHGEHFHHNHRHQHILYHSHAHEHDRIRKTLVHRVLKNPVRDWFGIGTIGCLFYLGRSGLLETPLAKGLLLAATVIGLFPLIKDVLQRVFHHKEIGFEIIVVALVLLEILTGHFYEAALAMLFLHLGSSLRLSFSWGEH